MKVSECDVLRVRSVSLVEYGINAWGGAYKTTWQPLFVIQKPILNAAYAKHQRFSTDGLFNETSIIPVHKLFTKHPLVHIITSIVYSISLPI